MSKRKWTDSKERFNNLEELINAKIVMFNGRAINNAWVGSQQVRWLQEHFECFTKAKSKEKMGELTCNEYCLKYNCRNCAFNKLGLDCGSYREDVHFNALKEGFLKDHPLLEPLRPVIEKELDKEVEE